jgi:hypothetical protein
MPTADGVEQNSVESETQYLHLLDSHDQQLEDAISWCIENRALVKFFGTGMVEVNYTGGHKIGDTFLDTIQELMT